MSADLAPAYEAAFGAPAAREASFAVVPGEFDLQIGEVYRARTKGGERTFIVGLGNDEIGYQLPAASGTTRAARARARCAGSTRRADRLVPREG